MQFYDVHPGSKLVLLGDKLQMRASRYAPPNGTRMVLSLYLLAENNTQYRYDCLIARVAVPKNTPRDEQKRLLETMADIVATRMNKEYRGIKIVNRKPKEN